MNESIRRSSQVQDDSTKPLTSHNFIDDKDVSITADYISHKPKSFYRYLTKVLFITEIVIVLQNYSQCYRTFVIPVARWFLL